MSHLSHFLSHLSHLLKNSQIGRLCVCLTCLTCLNPPPLSSVRLPPPSAGCGLPKTCKIGPQSVGRTSIKTELGEPVSKTGLGEPVSGPSGLGEPKPIPLGVKKTQQKRPATTLSQFRRWMAAPKKTGKIFTFFFFDAGIEAGTPGPRWRCSCASA